MYVCTYVRVYMRTFVHSTSLHTVCTYRSASSVCYVHNTYMVPPHLLLTLYRLQKDQSRSMDTEIESYKKAVLKEQEQNEQLTGMLRKLDTDIAHVKKQVEASHAKREQLKVEYMTYTRALQETEEMLGKTTTVGAPEVGRRQGMGWAVRGWGTTVQRSDPS